MVILTAGNSTTSCRPYAHAQYSFIWRRFLRDEMSALVGVRAGSIRPSGALLWRISPGAAISIDLEAPDRAPGRNAQPALTGSPAYLVPGTGAVARSSMQPARKSWRRT